MVIFVLSLFAMRYLMHGNSFLVIFYIGIILAASLYYLIGRERNDFSMRQEGVFEWIAFAVEIIAMILPFFVPNTVVLIPIVLYDVTRSRNYIAGGTGALSFIFVWRKWLSGMLGTEKNASLSFFSGANMMMLFLLTVSFVSIILAVKSEMLILAGSEQRRLRDDGEEKSERLRIQNKELLMKRDNEVYSAQLAERNRIAREIHDNVGHVLSRALLQMGALLAIHKEEPVHSELSSVRETLDTAMTSIRTSVHDLHDDSIDVRKSITDLAEPLKGRFSVSLDIDYSDGMPREIKYVIIGIVKEGVSNIIKHSRSGYVDIRLNEHPSMYQLVIHDYGTAQMTGDTMSSSDSTARVAGGSTPGMGLENIRNRAESVGGTCNISDENGFRIFVTIPARQSYMD